MPQGPLLFNIYLCDLFLFTEDLDIAHYADDTTPYHCSDNTESVIEMLEIAATKLFQWFKDNNLKANADKCHLLLSTNESEQININDTIIDSSKAEKLLKILIDNKLNFDKHVSSLCVKAGQKLHGRSRISSFINIKKRKLIMNAFITSQFGYCPLVWMFHCREMNNRINRIHERSLRIVYKNKQSTFQELLDRDKSVTVHHSNIRKLAIETFKVKNNLSPEILNDVFEIVRTVRYGTETISFLDPKIWEIVPTECKTSCSIHEFKCKIKQWIPTDCPCRLCKTYINQPGWLFIAVFVTVFYSTFYTFVCFLFLYIYIYFVIIKILNFIFFAVGLN